MSRWHYNMILLTGAILIVDTADQGLASASQVDIARDFGVQQTELGLLISAAFFGATFSAALIGFLADRFGRRRMIALSILLFSVATAGAALSQDFSHLIVLRVVAGIGYGGLLPLAWAFGSEFAPTARRGRTLSWLNAFYGAGSALAYLIGLVVIAPFGWRWGFAVFLIPALLAVLVLRRMPEGVPYLIRKGRIDEARAQVERIEEKVLRGQPRPTPVLDADEMAMGADVSLLGAARQLFGRRHLLATASTIMAWPVPAMFVTGLLSFYPLIFVNDLGLSLPQVLAFLTFSSFMTILGRVLSGFFLDPIRKLSPSGMKIYLAVGVAFFGIMPFVIIAATWSTAVLFVLLCAQYLLQGLWAGAAMTYVPTVLPLALRNSGLGLFSALTNTAQIAGPILIGTVLEVGGTRAASTMVLIASLLCAFFVLVFGHRERIIVEPDLPLRGISVNADTTSTEPQQQI
nr:MFS transporter [Rhodococcus sp. (in: high G+C Gram-positive bacteria)]